MNPVVILFAVFATAFAVPVPEPDTPLLAGGWAAGAPLAAAGFAGIAAAPGFAGYGGLAAAPGFAGYAGLAAAPAFAAAPVAVAPAPVAVAPAPYVAHAPVISVPAPYSTAHVSGPDAVSVHQPPPVVNKRVEYADRPYVAAYDTLVIKPLIGDIDIAVPTALKGTVSHNAPITRVSKEPFVVNEPVPVERPYNVPYDVIKNVVKTVEVPTPVHVDAPYNVPVPTPVRGEPIIQKVVGPPRIVHTHERRVAPAVHTGAVYHGHGVVGAAPAFAAAPALGWQ